MRSGAGSPLVAGPNQTFPGSRLRGSAAMLHLWDPISEPECPFHQDHKPRQLTLQERVLLLGWRKARFYFILHLQGSQGRSPEAGTDAKATEEYSYLNSACFLIALKTTSLSLGVAQSTVSQDVNQGNTLQAYTQASLGRGTFSVEVPVPQMTPVDIKLASTVGCHKG